MSLVDCPLSGLMRESAEVLAYARHMVTQAEARDDDSPAVLVFTPNHRQAIVDDDGNPVSRSTLFALIDKAVGA